MSTIKVANIQAPGAESPVAHLTADGDFVVGCMNGGSVAGMRNVLRNIRFQVWSRQDVIEVGNTYSSTFGADGWSTRPVSETGGTTTLAPSFIGSTPCMELTASGHTASTFIRQRVEDVRTLAGKKVSLSFQISCSNAFTAFPVLTQNFGEGSTRSEETFGSIEGEVIVSPGIERRVTWTFDVPSVEGFDIQNDSYLELCLRIEEPYTGKIRFISAQLESGDMATPLEDRPLSVDKKVCERFSQSYNLGELESTVSIPFKTGAATFQYPFIVPLATRMRTIPSVSTADAQCGIAAGAGDEVQVVAILAQPRTETLIAVGGVTGANNEGVIAFGGKLWIDAEL